MFSFMFLTFEIEKTYILFSFAKHIKKYITLALLKCGTRPLLSYSENRTSYPILTDLERNTC